jgi:protein-tyrosine phosphatase
VTKPAILFVCLGNICRSPLAEAAFRRAAAIAGLDLTVDSAGTGDWHLGHAPDSRAQAVAAREGIDISGYRARQVTSADFGDFDHIVAMDQQNLDNLEAMRPVGASTSLSLLLDHVPGREGQSVADPWAGEADGFEVTWADVTAGAGGMVAMLKHH